MRLFIAREALDPHLKVGGAIFNTQLPMMTRVKSMFSSGSFYTRWYPKQWMGGNAGNLDHLHADLRQYMNYGASTSKRLARGLFHAMMRFGPKLDREQLLLSRFVGVATELFAISATCAFAQAKINAGPRKFSRSRITSAVPVAPASIITLPERAATPTSAATISRKNCSPANTNRCVAASSENCGGSGHVRSCLESGRADCASIDSVRMKVVSINPGPSVTNEKQISFDTDPPLTREVFDMYSLMVGRGNMFTLQNGLLTTSNINIDPRYLAQAAELTENRRMQKRK